MGETSGFACKMIQNRVNKKRLTQQNVGKQKTKRNMDTQEIGNLSRFGKEKRPISHSMGRGVINTFYLYSTLVQYVRGFVFFVGRLLGGGV